MCFQFCGSVCIDLLKLLPSVFQVKRKDPLDLEEGDMKRPRPSTPPDEDDEGLLRIKRVTLGFHTFNVLT